MSSAEALINTAELNVEESRAKITQQPSKDQECKQKSQSKEQKLDQRQENLSFDEDNDHNLPESLHKKHNSKSFEGLSTEEVVEEESLESQEHKKHNSKIFEGLSTEEVVEEESLECQECSLVEEVVQEFPMIISEENGIAELPNASVELEGKELLEVIHPAEGEAVKELGDKQKQHQSSEEERQLDNEGQFEKPVSHDSDLPSEGYNGGVPLSPSLDSSRQQSSLEGDQQSKQDVTSEELGASDENSGDNEPSSSVAEENNSQNKGLKGSESENEVFIGLAADRIKDKWFKKEAWDVNASNASKEDIWSESAWKEVKKTTKPSKRKGPRGPEFKGSYRPKGKSPRNHNFNICWDYQNDPKGCRRGQNCTWKHPQPLQKNQSQDKKPSMERASHAVPRPIDWKKIKREKDLDLKSQGVDEQLYNDKKSFELNYLKSTLKNLKERNVELVHKNYLLDCENQELKSQEKLTEELRVENEKLKRLLKEKERPPSPPKSYDYRGNHRPPYMPYSLPPRRMLQDRRYDEVEANIPPINHRRHYSRPMPQPLGMYPRSQRVYPRRFAPPYPPRPYDLRDWYGGSSEGIRYRPPPPPPPPVDGGLVRPELDPRSPRLDREGCPPVDLEGPRDPGQYFPNRMSDPPLIRERYGEENRPAPLHPNQPPPPSFDASPHAWEAIERENLRRHP